jgi:hypothetical protein
MAVAKRGNPAATREREKVFKDIALFAQLKYTSTIYLSPWVNKTMIAVPMGIPDNIWASHGFDRGLVNANQKRPAGRIIAATIIGGRRRSGSVSFLSLAPICFL